MARGGQWVWAPKAGASSAPNDAEKRTIVATCERFITDVLKPRFLPAIEPTEWNYPVDIRGDFRAGRYRFIQRYRSGHADNLGDEFDAPFARLNRMARDRFDVYAMRYTGQWWLYQAGLPLDEALALLESEPLLQPLR